MTDATAPLSPVRPGRPRPRVRAALGRAAFTALAFQALAVAGGLLLAAVAPAQVTQTSEYLKRMDTNADGRIGPDEYVDWMTYAFDARDLDHDGVLSTAEQPGGRGRPVSRDTHRARWAATFRRQDVNHDGFLDARELAAPPQ